jgi:hypothetical protein
MVTLAAYGSVSDAYYTKPTSTHVDCDGITLASSFEESVYLLAGLILTRLASSLPISMLAHCFAGWILTRLASSLPISLLAKLSSSLHMIHSQRLASSLLHWIDIDKAGKLIAHFVLAHRGNKIIHTIQYETCGDLSPFLLYKHAPPNTHAYTYICICISQGKTTRT